MFKYLAYTVGVFLLLLVHGSLLFCTDHAHCLIPFKQPPLSPVHAYYLRTAIANFLPYPIKTVQGVAQYAIMIEVLLVIWLVIKMVTKIINILIETIILIIVAFTLYRMYWFWRENPNAFYA